MTKLKNIYIYINCSHYNIYSHPFCIILIKYLFLILYHFLHLISCRPYRVLASLVYCLYICIVSYSFKYKFIHSCLRTHTYYFNSALIIALILPSYWPWTRWVRPQVFLKLKLRSKIDSIYAQILSNTCHK